MRSPAIMPGFGFIARPSLGHGLGRQVEAVQIVIHSGVRGGFGHQQEISAALDECLTQRLPGVEVVTEVHGSQVLVAGQIVVQPSFGGIDFTILYCGAILRCNEFGS